MKIKTLLLGSAAVLGVVGAAQAADVVKPAAVVKPAPVVQYVQVCDLYGIGYFVLPGQKDTCLRIQGQVQFQLNFHTTSVTFRGKTTTGEHSAAWSSLVQGQITVTAKRQTDHGDLVGVVRLTATSNNAQTLGIGSHSANSATTAYAGQDRGVTMDRGYIQLGNKFSVLVGYNSSVYGSGTTKQVSFDWNLGGGTDFQFGIDDPRDRWGSRLPTFYWMPDLVASLSGNYVLGTWGFSGGLGSVSLPDSLGTAAPGPGNLVWGATAKTTINTPMIAKGDQIALSVAFGTGCQFVSCGKSGDGLGGTGTSILYQASAGFKHVFNTKVNTNTVFQWSHVDVSPGKTDSWQLSSTTQYLPTNERNLQLQFKAQVQGTVGSSTRNWSGQIQDQYTF